MRLVCGSSVACRVYRVRGVSTRASAGTTTNGAETGEETAPEEGQRKETARTPASNPSTSGFTGKPALVLDRPGGIPQGYDLTSRRSVTEPRWVSSPPSYCATAPLRTAIHVRSRRRTFFCCVVATDRVFQFFHSSLFFFIFFVLFYLLFLYMFFSAPLFISRARALLRLLRCLSRCQPSSPYFVAVPSCTASHNPSISLHRMQRPISKSS